MIFSKFFFNIYFWAYESYIYYWIKGKHFIIWGNGITQSILTVFQYTLRFRVLLSLISKISRNNMPLFSNSWVNLILWSNSLISMRKSRSTWCPNSQTGYRFFYLKDFLKMVKIFLLFLFWYLFKEMWELFAKKLITKIKI